MAYLFGWQFVTELVTLPLALWLHLPGDLQLAAFCPAALVTAAWIAARLSIPRGAPVWIWVPMVFQSLATFSIFGLVIEALAVNHWYFAGVAFVVMGIPVVVFFEYSRFSSRGVRGEPAALLRDL